jgi:hypothetical protein
LSASDEPFLAARRKGRIAFYSGDVAGYTTAIQQLEEAKPSLRDLGLLEPFNAKPFERTPVELRADILVKAVTQGILTATGSSKAFEAFDAFVRSGDLLSDEVADAWVNLLFARGDLKVLSKLASAGDAAATGGLAFLTGNFEAAEAAFDELTVRLRKTTGNRRAVLPLLPGLLHLLLLLRNDDLSSRKSLAKFCKVAETDWPKPFRSIPEIATVAVAYRVSLSAKSKSALKRPLAEKSDAALPLVKAITAHIAEWFLSGDAVKWGRPFGKSAATYERLNLEWLAALCEDASAAYPKTADSEFADGQRHEQLGTFPMLTWIRQTPLWKRRLQTLQQIGLQF